MNTLTILGTSLLLAVFVLSGGAPRSGAVVADQDSPSVLGWPSSWMTADPGNGPTTEPITTPTPQTAPRSATVPPRGSIEALICDWAWDCAGALSVAFCESRYDPLAYNASGASGVFQLMMPLHASRVDGDVFDAETNIAAAFGLWNETRDWRHWRECR